MKNVRSKNSRFIASGLVGVLFGAIIWAVAGWKYAPLAGWDAAVVVLVGSIWYDFRGHTAEQTARVARRDDMNRWVLDAIVMVTSLLSIVAVITLLTEKNAGPLHIAFGFVSIVLSWMAVHALYTLRYATLYYRDKEGGIDFNSPDRPVFSDFAYMAFTIGMTYQIADTDLTTSEIRRVVLGHAFISFIFGVAIIATTINFLVSVVG